MIKEQADIQVLGKWIWCHNLPYDIVPFYVCACVVMFRLGRTLIWSLFSIRLRIRIFCLATHIDSVSKLQWQILIKVWYYLYKGWFRRWYNVRTPAHQPAGTPKLVHVSTTDSTWESMT